MLPEAITTQEVREISDLFDDTPAGEDHQDAIFETMQSYIDEVVNALAKKHNLDDLQIEELTGRIGWRLELFPAN